LTDLTTEEVTDLFSTVQKVQKMLARIYFVSGSESGIAAPEDGSFNIAIQDGPDSGQSVPHVHCHVIPRLRGDGHGDDIYNRMASEDGNVGSALWDSDHRPKAGGKFPKIEDAERTPRSTEDMVREAQYLREQIRALE
jgi:bis(5'-adenosyl)-triphosphatase